MKYIDACFRMIDTIWQNGFAITEHVSVADVLLNGASKPKPTLTAEKEHLEIYARRSLRLTQTSTECQIASDEYLQYSKLEPSRKTSI